MNGNYHFFDAAGQRCYYTRKRSVIRIEGYIITSGPLTRWKVGYAIVCKAIDLCKLLATVPPEFDPLPAVSEAIAKMSPSMVFTLKDGVLELSEKNPKNGFVHIRRDPDYCPFPSPAPVVLTPIVPILTRRQFFNRLFSFK